MNRHRIDVVALIIGLAFAMTGVGFIINEATGNDINGGAALAVGLIILGVIALLITLLRPKERHDAVSGGGSRSELAGVLSVGEAGTPPSSEGDKE